MTPIDWSQITGKPATFPPDPHTHHPDDLSGVRNADYETRGDGAGLHTGLVHITANAVDLIAPDGGMLTSLFYFPIGRVSKLVIIGNYNNADVFQDELTIEGFVPPFSLPVQVYNNVLGAPGARTYSIGTNNVRVVIAGGPPNPIKPFQIRFLATLF